MKSSFLCVIVIGLFTQKNNAYELADYVMSNDIGTAENQIPLMRTKKTRAYLICADKTKVSPDMILNIKGGDWRDGNPKIKAFVQCVLMENELMTDQSVFRLDVAFKYLTSLEKKALEANIDKCLPTYAMPPVEISWQFAKCYQLVDPENSLF